jgi:fibronectin type 3 domain-containing protein
LIASNTTSPFVHTGLTNGTTYYYFVTRVTGSTDGPPSLAAMAVPQAAIPAAPTGVTISTAIDALSGTGTVTLTIPNADPNLTYNVYWTTNTANIGDLKGKGTPITNAFTTTATGATFTHKILAVNGTPYYYAVTAVGDSESAASQTLSAAPVLTKFSNYSATGSKSWTPSQYGSPQSIEADVANQAVTIKWGAPNSSPTKYETDTPASKALTTAASNKMTYNLYYWGSNGSKGSTPQISNITPDSNNAGSLVLNSGLANGTTYFFCVTAVQTVYDSTGKTITTKETPSAIISVMPQAKVLAMPSAVAASAGNMQVALSWAKVSDPAGGAVKYNVYCTTTAPASGTTQSNWTLIGTATTNSYVHSGLTAGNTYYYVITSLSDQSAESAGSWTSSQVAIKL